MKVHFPFFVFLTEFDFAEVGQRSPPGGSPVLQRYENPLYESPTTVNTNSDQQPSSPQPGASPSASSSSSSHAATDIVTGSSGSPNSLSADANRYF